MRVQQPIAALVFAVVGAWGQRQGPLPGGPGGTPLTPKAGALIDLTGYWASVVPEGSRFRVFTPPKSDFAGVPLNADGTKLAKEWDPAKDEASGEQCKSYGAAAIMGIPGRFHITWDNDTTLKIETEAGTQTRLLHFNAAPPQTEAPSWQGYSVAAWDPTLKHGKQGGGSLKVTTANLRPGYLRKNGVPYSGKTTVTEYYDLVHEPDGAVLVVNTAVEDPIYLTDRFRTSTNLRKQWRASGWNPSACSAR
jgi:hypothetical protein